MMVNLCGPPAAGKSTHAKRFCFAHSTFQYLAIDDFRMQYEEEDAWYNLMKTIANTSDHCIVESSGLSWRLHSMILDHPTIKRRGILTVYFHGNEKIFHERLEERQRTQSKPEIPFKYKNIDEHELIEHCLNVFPTQYKHRGYIAILSDSSAPQEKVYQTFQEIILDRI